MMKKIVLIFAMISFTMLSGCIYDGNQVEKDVGLSEVVVSEVILEEDQNSNTSQVDIEENDSEESYSEKQELDIVESDESVEIESEIYTSFDEIINQIKGKVGYENLSAVQKEYCRGEFFEINGKQALMLSYFNSNKSEQDTGYFVGIWIKEQNNEIKCITDQMIENVDNYDDVYVTSKIRLIDEQYYLNTTVRINESDADIWKNVYYLIDSNLVLKYDLYSEQVILSKEGGMIQHDEENSIYLLNQENVDKADFYSMQDELNRNNIVISVDFVESEGISPQGYTFDELLGR